MQRHAGNPNAVLVGLLLFASACAPAAPPAGGPPPTTGGAETTGFDEPLAGGRLIVGDASDSKTLQPVLSTDTSSSLIWARIYDSLIDVDYKTGAPVGQLAEK